MFVIYEKEGESSTYQKANEKSLRKYARESEDRVQRDADVKDSEGNRMIDMLNPQ